MIASLGHFKFKGKLLTAGNFAFPIALVFFALIRSLPVSLLVLLIVGWGYMVFFNMANILVQTHVEDEFRGRVMGVYALNFGGFMPLGALLAGAVAAGVGAPVTVIAGSAITVAIAALVWWMAPRLRALE
jgi:predicted MFS family arabinose efflux permease